MDWLEVFKPKLLNVILTIIPFLVLALILPLIPVLEIVICDQDPCNPVGTFFTMAQIMKTPQLVAGVRYIPLIFEIVFMYVFVSIALAFIFLFRKEGEGYEKQDFT
jgi:hypothetical protein